MTPPYVLNTEVITYETASFNPLSHNLAQRNPEIHYFSNMSSVIVTKSSVILAFKFVNIWNWCRKHLVLNISSIKRSQGWVISGDRGGQGVGSSLPFHLSGNVASKNRRTFELQCGGAPSW